MDLEPQLPGGLDMRLRQRFTRRRIEDLDNPEIIGLREFTTDSPWGPMRIQFWLARRRDGRPHAQFVAYTLYGPHRTEDQVEWLHQHRDELYQRMHEVIQAEWPAHTRRPLPPLETPRYRQLSLWELPPARA